MSATPTPAFVRCLQQEHQEWWGTNPIQPSNMFYPRFSRCKKCLSRVRVSIVAGHDALKSKNNAVETVPPLELDHRDLKRHDRRKYLPVPPPSEEGTVVSVGVVPPAVTTSHLLLKATPGELQAKYGLHYTPAPAVLQSSPRFFKQRTLSPAFARRHLDAIERHEVRVVFNNAGAAITPEIVFFRFTVCSDLLAQATANLSPELSRLAATPIDHPSHPSYAQWQPYFQAAENSKPAEKEPEQQQGSVLDPNKIAAVRTRMDLTSLEQRMMCRRYTQVTKFVEDLQRVWSTALLGTQDPQMLAEIRRRIALTSKEGAHALELIDQFYLVAQTHVCAVCRVADVHQLLPCDGGCYRSFHLSCTYPQITSRPAASDYWVCNECNEGRVFYHWDNEKQHYFCFDITDSIARMHAKEQSTTWVSSDDDSDQELQSSILDLVAETQDAADIPDVDPFSTSKATHPRLKLQRLN